MYDTSINPHKIDATDLDDLKVSFLNIKLLLQLFFSFQILPILSLIMEHSAPVELFELGKYKMQKSVKGHFYRFNLLSFLICLSCYIHSIPINKVKQLPLLG